MAPIVAHVTTRRRFGPAPLGKILGMTSATTDLTSETLFDIDPAVDASTPTATTAVAADADRGELDPTRAAEAQARRARRHDNVAWAALALGLVISLGTFGFIAYENSAAQTGGGASVSTTP